MDRGRPGPRRPATVDDVVRRRRRRRRRRLRRRARARAAAPPARTPSTTVPPSCWPTRAERAGVPDATCWSPRWASDVVADGATPAGVDDVFAGVPAGRSARPSEDLLGPRAVCASTVLRPGSLTDEPGTGRVRSPTSVERGLGRPATTSPRSCVALLDEPRDGIVLELPSAGRRPVDEAGRRSTAPVGVAVRRHAHRHRRGPRAGRPPPRPVSCPRGATPSSASSATRAHEADLAAERRRHRSSSTSRRASVDDLAAVVVDADAVVFAAGAQGRQRRPRPQGTRSTGRPPSCSPTPPSGPAVRPYLLVSSMGVESVADGRTPDGRWTRSSSPTCRRSWPPRTASATGPAVDMTILRPGRLTDEPGTGRVDARARHAIRGISRDDVAAVMLALLDPRAPGHGARGGRRVDADRARRWRRPDGHSPAGAGDQRAGGQVRRRAGSRRAPASAHRPGATGTSLARSVRVEQRGRPLRGPPALADRRAARPTRLRTIEWQNASAEAAISTRLAGPDDVEGEQRADRSSRPRGGGRRRRSRARRAAAPAASGHRVGVERARPADGVGPAQRRRARPGRRSAGRRSAGPSALNRASKSGCASVDRGDGDVGRQHAAQPADQPVAPAPPTARGGRRSARPGRSRARRRRCARRR